MSQANFPNITPEITINREDSINLILASIALSELGLSHVLNAEGEKLQYVLGTLPGVTPPATPPTISDILAINDTIRNTLNDIARTEFVLANKLESLMQLSARLARPVHPDRLVQQGPRVRPDRRVRRVQRVRRVESFLELPFSL